jgi:hypothetical protein
MDTGMERLGEYRAEGGIMPLTLAGTGVALEIKRIGGSAEMKQHLSDLGFVVGGEVTVISASLGNVIVKIKDARVAISEEMANKIMV